MKRGCSRELGSLTRKEHDALRVNCCTERRVSRAHKSSYLGIIVLDGDVGMDNLHGCDSGFLGTQEKLPHLGLGTIRAEYYSSCCDSSVLKCCLNGSLRAVRNADQLASILPRC